MLKTVVIIMSLTVFVTFGNTACDYRENTVSANSSGTPTPAVIKADTERKRTVGPKETLLSETENAYNPIPNSDGSLIAYVRTGWWREGGSGGFGRSNLVSEVWVMDLDGNIQTKKALSDQFLEGWASDGKSVHCFRDGEYSTVSLDGAVVSKGRLPNVQEPTQTLERVSFLPNTDSVFWLKDSYKNVIKTQTSPGGYSISSDFDRATIESLDREIATYNKQLDFNALLIPSPDGRYIAVAPTDRYPGLHLLVFDRQKTSWSNLGEMIVHPDEGWDYSKPSWNPWFADSSQLVFATKTGIVISSPDGKSKHVIVRPKQAFGLPVPSPDGKNVAYLTFEPTPMKVRADLKFWGRSTIWVTSLASNSEPHALTQKNVDTTLCLRWVNNNQLVFDRIADKEFNEDTGRHGVTARLWKVEF